MKQAKFSERDSKGLLYVDCIECKRGSKGDDTDKCSSGWRIKKGNQGGCFSGQLLDGLEVKSKE